GYNGYGQLGDGTNTDRLTPTQTSSLGTGRTVVAITAGYGHTCAILDDGSVSCWGRNNYGQLGDGTSTQRNTPTAIEIE
ncbi:chromosome condensation regulator RCC1, partial [Euryarchaeota archaeon]|nr:chromosome condensation regulator RCC1 [Euryarchaeota archaeon]